MKSLVLLLLVLLTATAVAEPTAPRGAPAPRQKPAAPLAVTMESRPEGELWRVTLTATPSRDVGGLELTVGDRTASFPATRRGVARQLSVVMAAPGGGEDVYGGARLVENRRRGRGKGAVARIGAAALAKPAAPGRIHRRPNGVEIVEVRQ